MILLKRSIRALCHQWKRTLLVTAVYSILFFLLFLVAVLNITSETQIKDTQIGIGNSVYVRKVRLDDPNIRNSLSMFKEEEVTVLTTDSRVQSYNILVKGGGNLTDGEPYIANQALYDDLVERAPETVERLDNAQFIGVTDSRFSVFFSGAGFRLTDGKPISREDADEKVILISKAVAEINGWKVGDEIGLATEKGYRATKSRSFTAKIKGIYECPENSFIQDTIYYTPDSLPENYIFIPQTTMAAVDEITYQTNRVFVYLKSPDMIEGYVADMKEKLGDVVEDITQRGWKAQFRYSWDQEWNQIVSAPFQEISHVTKAAMLLIFMGTMAVVLLISSGELREKRRELGIWVACGEKKVRILIQMLLEKMIPITAAAAIAVLIGLTTAEQTGSFVVGDTSEQFNEQIHEQRRDTAFWELFYDLDTELNAGNYDFFYISNQVDLYRSRGMLAAVVCGGLCFMGTIMTVQIWSVMDRKPRELLAREQ